MQISVLIAVFVALFAAGLAESPGKDSSGWLADMNPTPCLALMGGAILIFASVCRLTTRFLLEWLERMGWQNRSAVRAPARVDLILQTSLLFLYAGLLTQGGWAMLICNRWRLGHTVLLWEIALLLPFVLMLLIKWYCFYPINYFIRGYVVAGQLAQGSSARPVWSRSQFMAFQIRHGLLILLVPLLLIFALHDLIELISRHVLPDSRVLMVIIDTVGAATVIAIFILSPYLLRYIWSTRSLPTGPLRDRLVAFCERLQFRYRDILLWNSYSAVANAAVMGLFWQVRYVLMSDALIENMPDEQIEAVFGHEAGHVKHHHILFLVLFIVASGSMVFLLLDLMDYGINEALTRAPYLADYNDGIMYGWMLLLITGWASLFGWVSRRFERQADVHAALTMKSPDESLDEAPENTGAIWRPGPHDRLGLRGAAVVGSALERIALLNGISIHNRSWRHSSIASRVAFLQQLVKERGAMSRFTQTVLLIKACILLGIVANGGVWCWSAIAN